MNAAGELEHAVAAWPAWAQLVAVLGLMVLVGFFAWITKDD